MSNVVSVPVYWCEMDDSRIMSSEDVIHIRDLVEDNSTTLMLAEIVGS